MWPVWLEQLLQDVKYGFRMMASHPVFTGMAVLSLALGIGANTAIYSFMDAVLLRSLPVQHPEQLVNFDWHTKDFPHVAHSFNGGNYRDPKTGFTSGNFPYPVFELFRGNKDVCSNVFAFADASRLNLLVQGQGEVVDGLLVSGDFFSGLGVPPAAGRLISPEDDRAGAPPVAVISFAYWQRRFANNPSAVGQSILVNNNAFTIAGVSAPEFYGVNPGSARDISLPLHAMSLLDPNSRDNSQFLDKNYYWVQMMGRLRPGVTPLQAQAALAGSFQQFIAGTAATAEERADLPALLVREGGAGLDSLRRQFSKPLYVLMTMVALILTIACANIANLLLARAASRRREIAVRLSLGAGRARVMRQLLTESVLLAAIGGMLGVALAVWGIRLLSVLIANSRDNFLLQADLNWHVLGFTIGLTLVTGILFGLAPAMQATRVDLTPALKESGSTALRGRLRRSLVRISLGHSLVVAQIAVSLLLLITAGLFVRTLSNLRSVSLGFNRENLLLFRVNAWQAGFRDVALARFYDTLLDRLRAIPGVRKASLSTFALVEGSMSSTGINIPGAPAVSGKPNNTSVLTVGPSFFSTMEIPILSGREPDERDKAGAPLVAVVNEKLVQTYFGGANPIGRRLGLGRGNAADFEIIGVAKNARYNSLTRDIEPTTYVPYSQRLAGLRQMSFELRTAGDPLAQSNAARQVVQQLDARIPVTQMRTQAAQIDRTISQELIFAQLCSAFAILALLIAAVGLYGTMAYAVARRTREIGIRMALGAQRRRILWMVVREVSVLGAVGVAIGLPAAYGASRFVESFLFGMKRSDPATVTASVAILLVAAILAGYAPARRASRTDPMVALRHE
jgi:macrolide transport system ATP-binding/permease protein